MAYGVKYSGGFTSKYKLIEWGVKISERNYTGVTTELEFDNSNALTIDWEKSGDDFFEPIKGSAATISIISRSNLQYVDLFTSDPQRYRIDIYRNDLLFWRGFVSTDLYSEELATPPYAVSIAAVDGFATLSNIAFDKALRGRQSLRSCIDLIIDVMKIELPVYDLIGIRADGMSDESGVLSQTYIDMAAFAASKDEPTYRDLLEVCLKAFSAQIFQEYGAICVRRIADLRDATGFRVINQALWGNVNSLAVVDSSMQEIEPAMYEGLVSVNNVETNLVDLFGFENADAWSVSNSPSNVVKLGEHHLRFEGSGNFSGFTLARIDVPKVHETLCLALSYQLTQYVDYADDDWEHGHAFGLGAYVYVDGDKWVLRSFGRWTLLSQMDDPDDLYFFSEAITSGDTKPITVEIPGIPANGKLEFAYELYSTAANQSIDIRDVALTIDFQGSLDEYLDSLAVSNLANNVNLSAELPAADLPAVPVGKLVSWLNFLDSDGSPTALWYDAGDINPSPLVKHLLYQMVQNRGLPAVKLRVDIFTLYSLGLNTVFHDSVSALKAYYTNSLQLDAVNDGYAAELVELPGYCPVSTTVSLEHVADLNGWYTGAWHPDFAENIPVKCGKYLEIPTAEGIESLNVETGIINTMLEYSTIRRLINESGDYFGELNYNFSTSSYEARIYSPLGDIIKTIYADEANPLDQHSRAFYVNDVAGYTSGSNLILITESENDDEVRETISLLPSGMTGDNIVCCQVHVSGNIIALSVAVSNGSSEVTPFGYVVYSLQYKTFDRVFESWDLFGGYDRVLYFDANYLVTLNAVYRRDSLTDFTLVHILCDSTLDQRSAAASIDRVVIGNADGVVDWLYRSDESNDIYSNPYWYYAPIVYVFGQTIYLLAPSQNKVYKLMER